MNPNPDPRPDTVEVEVFAPSVREPLHFNFPMTETVGSAAATAARAFGLQPTAPSFEFEGQDDPLDPSLTLEAAGIRDGQRLELVDVGGGV